MNEQGWIFCITQNFTVYLPVWDYPSASSNWKCSKQPFQKLINGFDQHKADHEWSLLVMWLVLYICSSTDQWPLPLCFVLVPDVRYNQREMLWNVKEFVKLTKLLTEYKKAKVILLGCKYGVQGCIFRYIGDLNNMNIFSSIMSKSKFWTERWKWWVWPSDQRYQVRVWSDHWAYLLRDKIYFTSSSFKFYILGIFCVSWEWS